MPVFRLVSLAIAKTFSKVFGLATMTFFGRLPSKDDDKMAIIGVLSVTWVAVALAAVFPPLAELVVPFLPDDEQIQRAVALGLAIVIPPFNGWLTTRIENMERSGRGVLRQMIYGYGYTAIIGAVVVALIVVVPVVKASYILRRIELKSIAVMIQDDSYDEVVDQIQEALARHGIETERTKPAWIIGTLFAALVWLLGDIYRRHMSRKMVIVRGEVPDGGWFEVTLHATDISIVGQKYETTVVMGILAEELDTQHLYFSWDDDSQALEDRISDCQKRLAAGQEIDPEMLTEFCDDLRSLSLESEEWNAIRRQIYGLECEYYKQRAGASDGSSAMQNAG